jgi:HD superfamily phosphodiesterase
MNIMATTLLLMNLINIGFKYVMETSKMFNIDESHALKHSMEVFSFAKKICESELDKNPFLENHKQVIYMAAIGHDMCDKKYMDENEGVIRYQKYLSNLMTQSDLDMMGKIILTMSYSKVKKNGYPHLGDYQLAYHIVREADLLAAYDIDRCVIYKMYHDNMDYNKALEDAFLLFDNRVLKMRSDKLFNTEYSKKLSLILHKKCQKDLENLQSVL